MRTTVSLVVISAALLLPAATVRGQQTIPESPGVQEATLSLLPVPAAAASQNISTGKYFLRSLVLPGWGELSLNHHRRGMGFLLTEGVLWSTFAAFQVYGRWREGDYKDLAYERAGVSRSAKERDFFFHVSNYRDIFEYNEEMRRFRRYDDVYPIDQDHYWRWRDESDRRRFDRLRLASQLAFRNATLTVAAVLVNHLLSAVDAVWMARREQHRLSLRAVPLQQNTLPDASFLSLQLEW